MTNSLPQYSKGQVNAAGLIIRDHDEGTVFTVEFDTALNVLGAWRASHAHPLQTVYMALRERARKIDPKALASQRLKRVPSIVVKLRRNQSMKLSTVQDIGGCRAVLADIASVRKLASKYNTVVRDYITTPKPDGYRSIHLVEQYEPTIEKHLANAGRKIELQLRTRLQHAWATAVETVDSLMGQNLKTGGGHDEWKRFFALASGVIAQKEKCPPVPGTPESQDDLREEIRCVADKLNVLTRLEGLATGVESIAVRTKGDPAKSYVLTLNMKDRIIAPKGFREWEMEDAATFYLEQEKKFYGDPSMQIVQVSVAQVRDLKRAFPNYYLSASSFLTAVREVLK